MDLEVLRIQSANDHTLGIFFDRTEGRRFLAFTLEDEARTLKVAGETRIPAGRYRITLRKEGGFHNRYSRKFPEMHQGMLWVRNVPNFTYVLIHIGNDDDDTAGCLLVGSSADKDAGFVGRSTQAYKEVYPRIRDALLADEPVWITYVDYDTGVRT